jgi:hypothetical protein
MIETAYQPFHQKVALVSHSMGGPVVHQFLASQSSSWKDTYVARFIAIAPPFSGTPEGLREYITGSLVQGNWVSSIIGTPLEVAFRSWPATVTLLPMETTSNASSHNRAWDNITLVSTPSKNYTGTDTGGTLEGDNVGELLEKIAETAGSLRPTNTKLGVVYWRHQNAMRSRVLNRGPGVATNCLFLTDVPTPIGAAFADDNMTKQTDVLYGEGDGSVAAVSTRATCQQWSEHKEVENGGYDVSVDAFALGGHVNHHTVLGAKEILMKVGSLLGFE